uniref:Uncharacterized protein n=1 Tax=Timema shepardi TaxID=629360 RepID=A0A7R9AZM8_TIMSH|nr:unnamed protein product [Timema shepardi]
MSSHWDMESWKEPPWKLERISNRPDEPLPVIPLATTSRSHISERSFQWSLHIGFDSQYHRHGSINGFWGKGRNQTSDIDLSVGGKTSPDEVDTLARVALKEVACDRDVTTFTTDAGGDEVAETTPGAEEASTTTGAAPIHNNTTNQDAITTVKINVVPLRTSTATPGAETTSAGVTSSSEEGGPTTQYTTRSFFKKRDAEYGSEQENDSNDRGVDGDDGPPDGGDFVKSLPWKRDVRDSDSYDIPYQALGRRRRSVPISDETSVDPPYADLIKKRIARDTDTDSDAETTPEETTDEEKTPDTSEEDGTDDEAPDDVLDKKRRDTEPESADGTPPTAVTGVPASSETVTGPLRPIPGAIKSSLVDLRKTIEQFESVVALTLFGGTGLQLFPPIVTDLQTPNADGSLINEGGSDAGTTKSVLEHTTVSDDKESSTTLHGLDVSTTTSNDKESSTTLQGSDAGTTKSDLEPTIGSEDKESSTTLHGSDAGTTKSDLEPTIGSDDKESSTSLRGSDVGTTTSNDKESSTTLHGLDDVVATSSDLSSSEDQSSTNGDDTNGVATSPISEHGAKTEAVTDANVLKTGGERDKADQPPGESVHDGEKRLKKEPYPIDFFFN